MASGERTTTKSKTTSPTLISLSHPSKLFACVAMSFRTVSTASEVNVLGILETLRMANNLGVPYADQGRLDEAEAMYERALDGYEKALGLTQANRYLPALNTLQNLADLYIQLDRAHVARPLYTRCQAGLAVVFGPQHSRYQERDISEASYIRMNLIFHISH